MKNFIFENFLAFIGMTSSEKGLKTNRQLCHQYRDLYFDCLKKNEEQENKCKKEFKLFENECPASWVPHFIRKYKIEQYKADVIKRGVVPLENIKNDDSNLS